jgi:hypothetical protein
VELLVVRREVGASAADGDAQGRTGDDHSRGRVPPIE